jgi:hypothetical protein
MTDIRVAGEPVEALLEALLLFKWKEESNGMARGSARLEPRLAQQFFRALMRVQAEFMLEDANRLGTEGFEDRTNEHRAADALIALALRITNAAARR